MDKPICLCDRCGEAMHCLLNYDGKACRKNRTVEPNNADRIRAMSDEELADFLAEQQLDLVETIYGLFKMPVPDYLAGVKDDALDWLKQEAEE